MSATTNIQVIARLRPINESELDCSNDRVLSTNGDNSLEIRTPNGLNNYKRFQLNAVLDESASQIDVNTSRDRCYM